MAIFHLGRLPLASDATTLRLRSISESLIKGLEDANPGISAPATLAVNFISDLKAVIECTHAILKGSAASS